MLTYPKGRGIFLILVMILNCLCLLCRTNALNEEAARHLLNYQFEYVKQYRQKASPKAGLASRFAAVQCRPAAAALAGSPSLHAVFCCQVHQCLSSVLMPACRCHTASDAC